MSSVRAQLVAAEARRVAQVLDGLPERFHPRGIRDRLYALQAATEDVTVPGWLIGVALGVPLEDRARSYVLTRGDVLVPAAVHEANVRMAAA